jgi:hypothetical protein
LTSFGECVEGAQLVTILCHHDLSAVIQPQALFLAERVEEHVAASRETGLERVGCVIETGVQYAGVSSGGVSTEGALLVKHDNGALRSSRQDGVGECQTDDSAADNRDVGGPGHAKSPVM